MKIAENRSERKESTKESQGEYLLIIMISSAHVGILTLNILICTIVLVLNTFGGLCFDLHHCERIMDYFERLSQTIERQWLMMVELKEGTFLDLEDIQEYENSGDHIRAQGKYQGKPRRGI